MYEYDTYYLEGNEKFPRHVYNSGAGVIHIVVSGAMGGRVLLEPIAGKSGYGDPLK